MDVPLLVRQTALSHGRADWIDGLADVVDELARRWHLSVGEAFADGTEAYVVAVTRVDGTPAVLKIPLWPAGAAREASVLRRVDGHGCARLLDEDPPSGGLLMERLGPSLAALDVPLRERIDVLVGLAAQIWRRPPDPDLPDGAAHANRLAALNDRLWDELGRPCSAAALDHARTCAARRAAAHDPARAVLLHGDVHQWNALQSHDGFRLIDPDGRFGEPELDLGVLMREDVVELGRDGPQARARSLAARTGLDSAAIWEWGVVERLANGLVWLRSGREDLARPALDLADAMAGQDVTD